MQILVAGGAGFIGSHTCVELLAKGYEVVILDNFSNSRPEVLDQIRTISGKDFKFYEVDLLDEVGVNRVFEENDIKAVIHFAAFKAVGESVAKPIEYYHNNLTGTFVLCKVMKAHGVKKIVFSSSATVYGDPVSVPIREDFALSATNPYGQTKLMTEQILTDVHTSDNEWGVVLLRYFNPIGAHPSGLIGEEPNQIPNNLVPYIAKVASGELAYLNVFGNDYNTVDGTGVRDYIHVVDLSKGHTHAIDHILGETGVKVYNLGTGTGYSVLEVLKAYEKASEREIAYKIVERRPGDIGACYADATKAKVEIGWEAEYNLDEMCKHSWAFTMNRLGAEANEN
ncbi:MAG: UDP-glucose 4-epimerase GalE [Cellulosilyticaceae bacterium]